MKKVYQLLEWLNNNNINYRLYAETEFSNELIIQTDEETFVTEDDGEEIFILTEEQEREILGDVSILYFIYK